MQVSNATSPGGKYYLSTFNVNDANDLVKILSNPKVANTLYSIPIPYLQSDALKWIEFVEHERVSNPQASIHRYAIREDQFNKLIGTISVTKEDNERWKVGFWLAEEHWGRGIMTWACSEAMKFARQNGVRNVFTAVLEGNWGSRRVLEKNGFSYLRTIGGIHHGKPANEWQFEIDLVQGDEVTTE